MLPTFVNAPYSGDQLTYKTLEEITNVRVEITEGGAGADYTTTLNLAMLSGTPPNIVSASIGEVQSYLADGLIVDMTEYINEYAPHYVAELSKDDALLRNATSEDGKFWYISKIVWKHDSTTAMINTLWLEEANLKAPETPDQFIEVLRAFKARGADVVPWTAGGYGGSYGVHRFAYFTFNTSDGFQLFSDGQFLYGPYEKSEEFKMALQWLNTLYQEKLLDNNYMTISNDEYVALVRQDKTGFVYGWHAANTWKVDAEGKNILPLESDWDTLPPLIAPDGTRSSSKPNQLQIQTFITSSHPDPAKAAKYFDYGFTDEGCLLHSYGVEGVTYNVVNGEKVFIDEIANSSSPMNTARHYGVLAVGWPGLQREIIPVLYNPKLEESIKINEQYWTPTQPMLTGTPDEEDTIASIMTDVGKLINESVAQFIAGELNFDSDWDTFIQQMKTFGIEDAIAIRKANYESWRNK